MLFVKRLTISGFRGIPGPLDLEFQNGGQAKSAIIYGENGTGKSSITDGWEWLATGRVEHLAREGAEERAYPNIGAGAGKCFVEAEFTDATIGTVRLTYDEGRITRPKPTGDLAALRKLVVHPCHIRYGDLTRFVYFTKAERYDALAALMGFVPQMEYQKALRRIENTLGKEIEKLEQNVTSACQRLEQHFGAGTELQDSLSAISKISIARGHGAVLSLDAASAASSALQKDLEQDPRAVTLVGLKVVVSALKNCNAPRHLGALLTGMRSGIERVRAAQAENVEAQKRIPLLSAASRLLESGPDDGRCPLCGQLFAGDLRKHVEEELRALQTLGDALAFLGEKRSALSKALTAASPTHDSFEKALGPLEPEANVQLLDAFCEACQDLDDWLARVRPLQVFDSSSLPESLLDDLQAEESALPVLCSALEQTKEALLADAEARITSLEGDPSRAGLVQDAQFVRDGARLIKEERAARAAFDAADAVLNAYQKRVSEYVAACVADVQGKFDEISSEVKQHFLTLEKHSVGLGEPRLMISPDQERSVILEVVFHGSSIQPAYKYLSESQLNSFGLAVFLASATHFNTECRFLILDDVVNSFDAYKRPQLIELLKGMSKRQILLLTHDSYWRDRLYRELPAWKRIQFASYSPGTGPTVLPGRDRLGRTTASLAEGEAEQAARLLAFHIEDLLQDICERFEVELKFNRRNEYTLDTLLDGLRLRARNKLGDSHPLSQVLDALYAASSFRNWVIHCKGAKAPIQCSEVQDVLEQWTKIEAAVACHAAGCGEIAHYDGKGFSCTCGQMRLQKVSAGGTCA